MKDELMKKHSCCHHENCESITVRPVADVTDEKEGVEICFEVPGCSSDDIKLEIKDKLLTLTALPLLLSKRSILCFKLGIYSVPASFKKHLALPPTTIPFIRSP